MSKAKSLHLGRKFFEDEKWSDAFTHLSNADNKEALQPRDLELLAVSAYLTGKFNACNDTWTRAYNSFLKSDEIPGAVRCAFWLGFLLMSKGETVRGGGWIGHARMGGSRGTFVLALFYGYLYLRVRNVYVMGIFHGWLAALFFYTVVGRDPFAEVFGKFL